jgi:excisionase family DNA binding protein
MNRTATKKKSGKKKKPPAPPDYPVLTLDETAAYLRLPAETVVRLVGQQGLPGRHIDGEWRFLKSAVDGWLSGRNGKRSLLSFAGEMADDDSWQEMLDEIYKRRGRPEVEVDE